MYFKQILFSRCYFGVILKSLWDLFKVFWMVFRWLFRDHFGVILDILGYLQVFLESFQIYSKVIRGLFKIVSESFWILSKYIWGLCEVCSDFVLMFCWGHLKIFLKSFWSLSGVILRQFKCNYDTRIKKSFYTSVLLNLHYIKYHTYAFLQAHVMHYIIKCFF